MNHFQSSLLHVGSPLFSFLRFAEVKKTISLSLTIKLKEDLLKETNNSSPDTAGEYS